MEKQYECLVTKKALNFIREKITSPTKSDYGLVISNKGPIGCGYNLQIFKLEIINTTIYYHILFPIEYHNHGFTIYVEPLLIREDYLPNSFVIDLVTQTNGTPILEIKNPEFETYDDK
jgi:hypothetical protein